jgi:hypothetical protein
MLLMATKPIPVRIPNEWLPRLDVAAKRLGTNRSRLIAFLAQTFAAEFEKSGMAMMPPDWLEILNSLDGRRNEKPRSNSTAAAVKAAHDQFFPGKPSGRRRVSKKPSTAKVPVPVALLKP